MTAAAPKKLVGFFNPDQVSKPGADANVFVTSVPGPEKALIMKLVANPDDGSGYVPMRCFPHQAGPLDEDRRFHPCATFFGEKSSPEWETLKTAYDTKDKLFASGKKEEDPEVQKQLAIIDTFKSKNYGWLYFIEPGIPGVRAVKIGQGVINSLFGRKGNAYAKEIPSLVSQLIASGNNPYDLTKNEGWLVFYKTGEGLATEYTIKLDETESTIEQNGKKFKAVAATVRDVNPQILELTTEDLPNPRKFEERNRWTLEESKAYVASGGTAVPARFLKGAQQGQAEGAVSTGPSLEVKSGPAKLAEVKAPTEAVSLSKAPF